MATPQMTPIMQEKATPYDEFNMVIPRETFPASGASARAAEAIVNSFAWTDANPMLNLSSFVTTYAEPEAIEVARTHLYKNYIDHDMYPQVFKMEGQIVKWLHDLWNGPKGVEPYGTATIGSSEACMLGGLAHKWNWREARRKAGKDASRPNMVTGGNVQIVWKKFLRYFDVDGLGAEVLPAAARSAIRPTGTRFLNPINWLVSATRDRAADPRPIR